MAVLTALGLAMAAAGATAAQAAELDLTGSAPACISTAAMSCAGAGYTTAGLPAGYAWFAGAIWSTNKVQPTGSGYIDSFLRIQDAGPAPGSLVVDGMNTSGALLNDEKPGPTFTTDVKTGDVSTVSINGSSYYQFLLDINQTGADPLLSLSGLQLCQSGSASLSFTDTCAGVDSTSPNTGTSTLKYDMDQSLAGSPLHPETAAPVNNVLLDYSKNAGSGSGDMFVYIPTSVLPTNGNNNTYLYLWSQFGLPSPYGNNDGYEEWAYIHAGPGVSDAFNLPNPEPGSLILLGTGLLLGGKALRLRRRVKTKVS